MTTLTDTQLPMLNAASSRADRLVTKHNRLESIKPVSNDAPASLPARAG